MAKKKNETEKEIIKEQELNKTQEKGTNTWSTIGALPSTWVIDVEDFIKHARENTYVIKQDSLLSKQNKITL